MMPLGPGVRQRCRRGVGNLGASSGGRCYWSLDHTKLKRGALVLEGDFYFWKAVVLEGSSASGSLLTTWQLDTMNVLCRAGNPEAS